MREIFKKLGDGLESPARRKTKEREFLRVALIQEPWHGNVAKQKTEIKSAIDEIKDDAPDLIILSELTLYSYACTRPDAQAIFQPEPLLGSSFNFAQSLAYEFNSAVLISLYEADENGKFNTAIVVNSDGNLISKTRKSHLPVTAGYYEDKYFDLGDSKPTIVEINSAKVGTPTCWDQWFPELAREYGLLNADLVCYPTAIGSEPDFPEFNTEPLWRQTMVAHGIANGFFVAAVNRIGTEDGVTFYGSSFISDPYGRIIVQAGRSQPAVIVADLDLDQKRDWLELFPFFRTRRPDLYQSITKKDLPTS